MKTQLRKDISQYKMLEKNQIKFMSRKFLTLQVRCILAYI